MVVVQSSASGSILYPVLPVSDDHIVKRSARLEQLDQQLPEPQVAHVQEWRDLNQYATEVSRIFRNEAAVDVNLGILACVLIGLVLLVAACACYYFLEQRKIQEPAADHQRCESTHGEREQPRGAFPRRPGGLSASVSAKHLARGEAGRKETADRGTTDEIERRDTEEDCQGPMDDALLLESVAPRKTSISVKKRRPSSQGPQQDEKDKFKDEPEWPAGGSDKAGNFEPQKTLTSSSHLRHKKHELADPGLAVGVRTYQRPLQAKMPGLQASRASSASNARRTLSEEQPSGAKAAIPPAVPSQVLSSSSSTPLSLVAASPEGKISAQLSPRPGAQTEDIANTSAADSIAAECYEFDLALMGMETIVPQSEQLLIEGILREHYGDLVTLYRKFSTIDAKTDACMEGQSPFGVSQAGASSLLGRCSGQAELSKAKEEFLYRASLFMPAEKKEKLLVRNEHALVRHQFIEWLLRVATARNAEASASDSVRAFVQALVSSCARYRGTEIEFSKAINSAVVVATLKDVGPQLQTIHDKMSTLDDRGQRYIVFADWVKLLVGSKVYDMFPGFKQVDVGYPFRLGLETQVDEAFSAHFLQMHFREFQRAVAAMLFLSELGSTGTCSQKKLAELLYEYVYRDLYQISRDKWFGKL